MNSSSVPNDASHAAVTPPANRWLSIRWVLPAMMLVPLVTGIGLTGWLAFRSSRAAVAQLIQDVSREVTNRIEQRIEVRMAEVDLLNNLLVSEFSSGALSVTNPDRMRQYFWKLVRFSPSGDAIVYANDRGDFLQVKRLKDNAFDFSIRNASTGNKRRIYSLNERGAIASSPKTQDYDPRQRPWYQAAMAAKAPVWTEVYQSVSPPDLTITQAVPVNPGSGTSEVVGVDVHLQSLSQFLNGLDISENGRAFIVERSPEGKGNLVATSQGLPFREVSEGEGKTTITRMEATVSPDDQIRETALYLEQTFGRFEAIAQGQPLHFRRQGQTQWVDVYPVKDKNLNWLVVVTIPEADFARQIYQSAQRTFIFGSCITGAVTLLSILLSRWLTKPIERLTQAANEIKHNQYQPNSLAEMMHRPDEFGELAALFEDMALVVSSREQGLAEQVAALHSEIAERSRVADENVSSVLQVLQHSKQVRQTYDDRQPNAGD